MIRRLILDSKSDTTAAPSALRCSTSVDEELDAMRQIVVALNGKDQKTCARILDWAASVYTTGVLMDGCIRPRDLLKPRPKDGQGT